MKTTIFAFFFLLFLQSFSAQELNYNVLKTLTNISFVSVDEYMINANGFRKIKEENNGKTISYGRSDKNIGNLVFIKIISTPKFPYNALEILTGRNTNISAIKREILSDGFVYNGNQMGFLIYKKDNTSYLIKENYNEVGANQIMFIFGE